MSESLMKHIHICVAVGLVYLICGLDGRAQGPRPEGVAFNQAVTTGSDTVPRLVQFAGVLKDAQGNSRAGAVSIAFAIYSLPEGGTALWSEKNSAPKAAISTPRNVRNVKMTLPNSLGGRRILFDTCFLSAVSCMKRCASGYHNRQNA